MGHSYSVPGLETTSDSDIGPGALRQDGGALSSSGWNNVREFGAYSFRQSHFLVVGGAKGLILAAFCLLAGCVDNNVAAQAPEAPQSQSTNMERRAGVSPSGATVAIVSFAGGPDSLRDSFSHDFDAAAKGQEIVMAAPEAANYLVRGYLNAVPEGEGTALTYVLDVFDSKKHRTQRVEDQILLKAQAADPWSVVDDSAISAVAAKSAAALAAMLTNTPEAVLAAESRPENMEAAVQGGAAGQTVVAATPPDGTSGTGSSDGSLRRVALH